MIIAFALPPILRGTDHFAEKYRYTVICADCGRQQSEVYYVVLGAELIISEKRLAVSDVTALDKKRELSCKHTDVLIGRTRFGITKGFALEGGSLGTPFGWDFREANLRQTLSQLTDLRPSEVLGRMQTLAEARQH